MAVWFVTVVQFEKGGYSDHASYSLSKLLDIMFNAELSRRAPDGVTCNSLDPGTVNTKMLRAGWGMGGTPVSRYGRKMLMYNVVDTGPSIGIGSKTLMVKTSKT